MARQLVLGLISLHQLSSSARKFSSCSGEPLRAFTGGDFVVASAVSDHDHVELLDASAIGY